MLTIAQSKVMIKGQYAFGFAGHFRFAQIIKSIFEPPVYKGDVSVEDWLSGEFAESLRHTVKVFGYSKNREGRDEGGHALIGFQGRLFLMQDEFDFCEPRDGIAAIGVGDKYALGAIKALALEEGVSVESMVLKALQVSEFYNGGVRAPFNVVKLGLLDGTPDHKTNSRRNKARKRSKTTRGNKRSK